MRTLKKTDYFGRDGLPLSIVRLEPEKRFMLHTHEFSEIVMVFGGRGLHVIGEESWPVAAGDVFVIRGSDAHEYREIKDLRLVNILFLPESVRLKPMELSGFSGYQELFAFESQSFNCCTQKRRLQLKPRELSVALNYVDSLEQEIKMREPGYSFMALSYFMQIVCYLSRAPGISQKFDPWARLCVSKAIDYLEAHVDQPIKVDELARLCCMSNRNFARAFRAATGSAPIAYLVNLRLARAGALLRRCDETVTSVAYKVGFNDSSYFTRQFHEMFGVAPSHYRKRQGLV
jgi:AraC family L-rhamnose operon transcriptional activator RhaR/AraC family L-rhamnose operon regulatory protein RhaS